MSEEVIQSCLLSILECIEVIENRFKDIKQADDFMATPHGADLFDAIAMRLQVIGENLKNIDKQDKEFLKIDSTVNWKEVVRLRDLISHHYFSLNPVFIFDVCSVHIPLLKAAVKKMCKEF